MAIRGTDNRNRAPKMRPPLRLKDLVLLLPLLLRHAVALFEIAASAEYLAAGARQHDDPHVSRMANKLGIDLKLFPAHLGIHGVADFGAVQRNDENVLIDQLNTQC
jgi:hypothetical protein